jgi:D-alanyl-D-alanine dipeptidase
MQSLKNVEDLATATMHTSQQFYFLIQDLLRNKFMFDDHDLKELHQEVTRAVEGLAWFEEKGLTPLSPHSIGQLVDVTLHHYQEFKAKKAGIELPHSKVANNLLQGKQ